MELFFSLFKLILKVFYWIAPNKRHSKNLLDEMLLKHNEYRKQHNLPSLKINDALCHAAIEHAEFMCDKGRLSHKNFNKRVVEFGVKCENVGLGGDFETVFDMWIKSSGHRRNILDNVSEAGFAMCKGYWVAIFS